MGFFVLAFVLGLSNVVSLIDPYASFGRIANNLFQPLWIYGNNFLAFVAEKLDSYSFYTADVWIKSFVAFAVAIFSLLIVSVLLARRKNVL